jgi:hypothetical protein
MALTSDQRQRALAFLQQLPGKRGVDIPADDYDRMYQVANGITLPVWGRPVSPHQLQWLYDQGATTPEAIHAAFNAQPHPHAPNVTVGEFPEYARAYQTHQSNRS